jgi:hypothetical protein
MRMKLSSDPEAKLRHQHDTTHHIFARSHAYTHTNTQTDREPGALARAQLSVQAFHSRGACASIPQAIWVERQRVNGSEVALHAEYFALRRHLVETRLKLSRATSDSDIDRLLTARRDHLGRRYAQPSCESNK